jgi:hypothetical protein
MQQQKQLTQNDDWQTRLAERMASKGWKADTVLVHLSPETMMTFAVKQISQDRPFYYLYFTWQWVLGPLSFFMLLYLVYVLGYIFKFSELQLAKFFTLVIILFPAWVFLQCRYTPKMLLHPWRRYKRLRTLLPKIVPLCTSSDILPTLLANRTRHASPSVDSALTRILTTMGGDEVFALPFVLRAELATLAEQHETPLDLSIAILLALTSARDGNIQPVLRRLSKDARSLRLREVAAECLREFSATP